MRISLWLSIWSDQVSIHDDDDGDDDDDDCNENDDCDDNAGEEQ